MILTDIHCHILPGVDDGAPDMMVTKDMLDKMYDEGVRRIIATPHYRVGMFEPSIRSIQSSYLEVKNYARTIGKYGMMVKLGCEYHRDDNMVGNLIALNWTLQRPFISSCIIGAQSRDKIEENCKVFEWKLSDDEMQLLEQALKKTII